MSHSPPDSPPAEGELHVACAADRNYLPHSAAMLHSILTNGGDQRVRIHYLHGRDMPESDLDLLAEMVEANGGSVSFLAVDEKHVAGLTTTEFLPPAAWYRIFLPDLLPAVDRVLCLDIDMIVLDSLLPLWETDLTGRPLAAVTNVFQHDHVQRAAELGLSPDSYFNSGVLLLNLEQMRRDDSTDALLAWARAREGQLWFADQDALNVVLGAARVPLHPRWNCMNSILSFDASIDVFGREAVEEARENPGIRHFEGPGINKPWHYLCDRDMRERYIEHRLQTPWPDIEYAGKTFANRVRRAGRVLARRSILPVAQ